MSLQTPRAFLFDLDGTLLDSLGDIAQAVNDELEERGLPTHPEDAYRFFIGNGMRMLLHRAAPSVPDDDLPAMMEAVEARYADTWHVCTKPYPGVVGLLQALRERGVPVGVLSNKPHAFTCRMTAHFFPKMDFFDVRGQKPEAPAKPHPAVPLEMTAPLGLLPQHICFVGDSRVDMETAVNAGMLPVGVTWGFRPREELLTFGARRLVDAAEELLQF